MPSEFTIPTTMFALFSTVIVTVLGLLVWFVKGVRSDQKEVTAVLDNHLGKIGENQAKTAQALDLIVTRLLDAVLPGPSQKDKVVLPSPSPKDKD